MCIITKQILFSVTFMKLLRCGLLCLCFGMFMVCFITPRPTGYYFDIIRHDQSSICIPKTNIMFLRTHKCGSSTIQNILMRFGIKRKLTFVLREFKHAPDSRIIPSTLTPPLPLNNYKKNYNILCHHTRWKESEIVPVMPNDTVYISIIREPAKMFESFYSYTELDRQAPIEEFLENPGKYPNILKNVKTGQITRNLMSYDFGLDPYQFENKQAIRAKISEIDKRFSLILLVNFIDESLVLLRKLLCWSWKDMVAFKINARLPKYRKNLSRNLQQKLRYWNLADTQLYRFFRQKFETQIVEYGRTKMKDDVTHLRKLVKMWQHYCVQNETSNTGVTSRRFRPFTERTSGFELTIRGANNIDCIYMATNDASFTSKLRLEWWPEI